MYGPITRDRTIVWPLPRETPGRQQGPTLDAAREFDMRRSLIGAVAMAAVTALTIGACGSSSGGGSSSASGNVTLKLVAADYGTGPDNTSQKYWQGISDAFHAANPTITVKVTDDQLERLRQPGPDPHPEPPVPGHHRGRLLLELRAGGPALLRRPGPDEPVEPAARVRQAGQLQRQAVRHAVHHQLADALLQQEAVPAGGHQRGARYLGGRPGRRGQDQGAGQGRLRPSPRAPRRPRPSRCCGSSATAATTRTRAAAGPSTARRTRRR